MTRRHTQGFTMVVVAALFIAFAVIAAALIERNTATQMINRRDATAEQLRRLSYAIIQYGAFNSGGPTGNTLLYPCPAQDYIPTSNSTFGLAQANCYNTAGDSGSLTGANLAILGGGTYAIRGMVPVQTLAQFGIGLNDAFDPWNNRIEYVVNRKLTPNSDLIAPAQGYNPHISDSYTGQALLEPDFILISYGRDGLGAIKRDRTTIAITCSGSANRQMNCNGGPNFIFIPTYTAPTADSNTYFDDILSFYRY